MPCNSARRFEIPFPVAYTVSNRLEALQLMKKYPHPYVLKNPLCSPYSPMHTIVCESVEDTLAWLDRIDYAEGVFLQQYIGVAEVGHFCIREQWRDQQSGHEPGIQACIYG